MGTLLARLEENAKIEEIKNELEKTKWQVFGYWLWNVRKKSCFVLDVVWRKNVSFDYFVFIS